MNPNSTKNTPDKQQKKKMPIGKRFKPGVSGNPLGRPKKGDAWADVANEILGAKSVIMTITSEDGNTKEMSLGCNKTLRHAVIFAQVNAAINGNIQAARELADRTEGKPAQMSIPEAGIVDLSEIAQALAGRYEVRGMN
jgi:hypothetical protein